jgi:hypothetical protein
MWLPVTPLCKPFVCKPFAHLHLHVGAQLLHLAAHGTHPPSHSFLFRQLSPIPLITWIPTWTKVGEVRLACRRDLPHDCKPFKLKEHHVPYQSQRLCACEC